MTPRTPLFWRLDKADAWAMEHNPHVIDSPEFATWLNEFHEDQARRFDFVTASVLVVGILAVTVPFIVAVMTP